MTPEALKALQVLPIMTDCGLKRITVRANGKAHRALVWEDGSISISCSCPGSQNGSLRNRCHFVADGWNKSNCGH